tara:strand:- start:1917 stop:2279 length:363 start_codon:yes stop_codon:yes gene_type:complete
MIQTLLKKTEEKSDDYEVNDHSPIGFGKMRGKPHNDLLKKENKKYAEWIMNQGEDFRYSSTRDYIIDNLDKGYEMEVKGAMKVIKECFEGYEERKTLENEDFYHEVSDFILNNYKMLFPK